MAQQHKPLAAVVALLDDGAKEDRMIAYFHHLNKTRRTAEVVQIFEEFFQGSEHVLENKFPSLHELLRKHREATQT